MGFHVLMQSNSEDSLTGRGRDLWSSYLPVGIFQTESSAPPPACGCTDMYTYRNLTLMHACSMVMKLPGGLLDRVLEWITIFPLQFMNHTEGGR